MDVVVAGEDEMIGLYCRNLILKDSFSLIFTYHNLFENLIV
jgi:hypothetical protein